MQVLASMYLRGLVRYGTQELRMDLSDVKDMYRAQTQQMMSQIETLKTQSP